MSGTTARAYPNLALVKYWGKRDEALMLPAAGSMSLTIDAYPTTTTVTLTPHATTDRFILNDREGSAEELRRVVRLLDVVRSLAEREERAEVVSANEAPTGAGLASSASGFAALATAAATEFGLELSQRDLSRLARRGSGSATRSIVPGLSVWHAGDDEESFAEPVSGPELRMVIVTVTDKKKAVSSRDAMRSTALTSPYYPAWIASTRQSLEAMLSALADEDFTRIGRITESHALRMHAVIEASDPPVRYLAPRSIAVFDAVAALRESGTECYATADAGPNVAAVVRPDDAAFVATALSAFGDVRIVRPGPGAALVATTGDGEPQHNREGNP